MNKIKSHKTVEEIAKKHRLEVSFVKNQLKMGIPIEHEHTKDKDLATDIALQHLDEIPDYYTRLKKMEASAKKSHKKYKDVVEEKKGLPPKKSGEQGYPKTLDIKEEMIRYCPKCEKNETRSECSYGPKYWDMFSLPIRLGLTKKYDPNRPHPANEEKDHEHSMARSEISTIISAAKRLKNKLKGEGNIEAWVQSKITKAADYIDSAADYLDSGQGKVKESVSIEDANGNPYVEFIDIIKPEPLKPTKGIGSKLLEESKVKTFQEFMEDWQKVNKQDKTDGMSQSAVDAYRRENPGSKLQTAVTGNPKPGSKDANRRANYCRRSKGQQDMHNIDCSKDPNKPICKARRRWKC